MESRYALFAFYALGAAVMAASLVKLKALLELAKATQWSLSGQVWIARRIASLIPFYDYDEEHFFRSDRPPDEIAARRRAGFMRLSNLFRERFAKSNRLTAEVKDGISDLQFTEAYRAPFQFRRLVREHLGFGAFVLSSSGVTLTDLDGNCFYDLTGSYGVNVLGNDFYKECIERGSQRVRELGPVLGGYHPAIAYNVKRLREISGQDEVSFSI